MGMAQTSGQISIKPWTGEKPPSPDEIESFFQQEGLSPSRWSNGPGDRYGEHEHSYYKVIYCAKGSIVFESRGEKIELRAGDRLEIPPGTPHSAVVGPDGTTCMEASR